MTVTGAVHTSTVLSTGLTPALANVSRTIDLQMPPIGQGAFGVAYRVARIDSRPCPPFVAKLLLDTFPGAARRGFDTVQELQRRLGASHLALAAAGSSLLTQYPALAGVPQLSFEGSFEGRSVVGYLAADLKAAGMEEFATVLDDDVKITKYQGLPLPKRMAMAAQVVDAFEFLSTRIQYIHADIKAEALFVDMGQARCALIDFDSGAVARSVADQPTTFGTRQDWLAPEIVRQLDHPGTRAFCALPAEQRAAGTRRSAGLHNQSRVLPAIVTNIVRSVESGARFAQSAGDSGVRR
jgi:hypothetical protein